jgi:serine phosphatase RsbU (regulator of sigma subunit)/anti-sigma regulatory factor (Ser/Thr protein kinase)
MHVGTMTQRTFTQDEIDLLQLVGDRVALALQARLSDRTRVVLDAFQRTFLPDVLPFVPGLRIATRYMPAASTVGVGGDWYDTFALPSGELVFVIGDVAGHGLAAASLMGKMRNALRAHALSGGSPGDIVARADAFHRHFGHGELVTLLVGVLSRDLGTFRFVSAGHGPPLVVDPGGAAFVHQERRNAPLGLRHAPSFTEEVVPLRFGTSILLYTDGLIERRDESLDVGLERLRETAARLVKDREPSEIITDLLQDMISDERPNDDVALMLIQRDAEPRNRLEFAVEARAHSLTFIRRAVSRWLQDLEVSPAAAMEVVTAVSEASANAVEHAYGPAGGLIVVSATIEAGRVDVQIQDSGRWRATSRGGSLGKGLHVMRTLMDDVDIESSERGSLVRMRRRTA